MPSEAQRQYTAEEQLHIDIASFRDDPLGYVYYAFPWGATPELKVCRTPKKWKKELLREGRAAGLTFTEERIEFGLDSWACEFMEDLRKAIVDRDFDPDSPETVEPIQMATRSGHGIGKSALVGILVSFILDTRPGSRGRVTANTGPQLETTTWPEIKTWKSRAITSHWWRILERKIVHVDIERENDGEAYGRCDAVTWNKDRSEAFAGQHKVTATSFYINDEASAIHDTIWEVQQGGLSDGEPMRFAFGNPTKNVGEFHRCFGKQRHRWICRQVDSRDAQITNKALIQSWIDDYGINSDFVRVRALGKEPKAGEKQLISSELVMQAMSCAIPHIEADEPVVMGIDVARSPLGDESGIHVRRGMDARSLPSPWGTTGAHYWRGVNTHQLASLAAEWFEHLRRIGVPPAAIFVDGGGLGAGTVDRLRALGYPVVEVLFGGVADRPDRCKQKDAEMWLRLKAHMDAGLALPEDERLEEQLTSRPYDHTDDNRLYLWPKDLCKKDLGIESPDRADALALTFAYFVERRHPGAPDPGGRCVLEA